MNSDNTIALRCYSHTKRNLLVALTLMCAATNSNAALLDKNQVEQNGNINSPGGLIDRSLSDQIGPGMGDWYTFGSSSYVIKRDPFRSIRRGRQLFQRKFTAAEGLGPRVNFHSSGDITRNRALGAGSADSCSACHGSPKGSAGFGGSVATFPDARDAPHLFGLGIVEQLAEEITEELRIDRGKALRRAKRKNKNIRMDLWAKGINYGYLIAHPNGTLDTSNVQGIDEDLRVRPFFAQGKTASMREFIVGAFKDEMGMETWDPVLCQATDPHKPTRVTSESGFVYDPALDTFERPPICDAWDDNDQDGIVAEFDPALVDHMEFYLLNYFKPGRSKVGWMENNGLQHMKDIGCTSCHVQNLHIYSDRRVADVDTRYNARKGIFNKLFATATPLFVAQHDSEQYPLLNPAQNSFKVKNIFTDLKRHDLGPKFHERDYDGSIKKLFMTEPLWGVGSTAPYGHDGRSIDLDQVIRRHGGEAQKSRDAYVYKLGDYEKVELQQFLRSLVLFPPDDTASNLNPGNPRTTNPQSPAEHGNIKLPALFQIPELGVE